MKSPPDGFSLIELSIVLSIIGLLAVAGWGIAGHQFRKSEQSHSQNYLNNARKVLVNFALVHNRLPCPDTGQDGFEEDCITASSTGGLPYKTLGLEPLPGKMENIVYGVYRSTRHNLTVVEEMTGNSPGDTGYRGRNDFLFKLGEAMKETPDRDQAFITGDNQRTGMADCKKNIVSNPAFVLAIRGESSGADNTVSDAPNSGLTTDGSGSTCFASPAMPTSAHYDDQVLSVSTSTLAGYMVSKRNLD